VSGPNDKNRVCLYLSPDFFKYLGGIIGAPVITVSFCHLVKCCVSFRLTCIPVEQFPVISHQFCKRIRRRQCHANAEPPFDASRFRIDKIVFMTKTHCYPLCAAGPEYTETSSSYSNSLFCRSRLRGLPSPESFAL